MSDASLNTEIKALIVEALALEDVTAEDIEDDAPLFGGGLGLDSIDALELAMALSRKYQVKFATEDEDNRKIFASVNALASHIAAHR